MLYQLSFTREQLLVLETSLMTELDEHGYKGSEYTTPIVAILRVVTYALGHEMPYGYEEEVAG
jgi:hypothetical protein